MRDVWVPLLAALTLLAGCDALSKVKSENPVFPSAPPRLSLSNDGKVPAGRTSIAAQDGGGEDSDEPGRAGATGELRTVGLSSEDSRPDDGPELTDTQVVATVNGQPIFASEVLDRYAPQLAQMKKAAPPAEFRKLREMLIRRDLPGHVERKILVQNLRSSVKAEQLKMLSKALDGQFEEEVQRMMTQMKVTTRADLEAELEKQQTSIETLKTTFINQRMAMEFLAAKSKYDKKIGRRELVDYYERHQKDYEFAAEVKWQQIVIAYEKHGGKDEAYQKALKPAIDELKEGKEFGEVAKKHSSGPTAAAGGHRDWMQKGSLDDESLEAALFELPVGSVSQVFIGEKAFQIVKVTGRREAGRTPFEKVQDEIRQKVELEARKAASQKFLEDLKKKAVIESPYLGKEKGAATDPLPFR